jgi:hypothetical protein
MEECRLATYGLCIFQREVLEAFLLLQGQVIIGADGSIIDINHIAVHQYLDMMEYTPVMHRLVFARIMEIHGEYQKLWRHYRPKKRTTPIHPSTPQSGRIAPIRSVK